MSVGIFPLVLFYIVDEKISRKRREKVVAKIKSEKNNFSIITSENTTLILTSKNKKEKLTLLLSELVYITSEGNYTCIYTKTNNGLKESILRNRLTNIYKDLELYSSLIRCHKSYIINTKYINDIQGNARGYILKSNDIPFDIPVSRNFPKLLLNYLIGK